MGDQTPEQMKEALSRVTALHKRRPFDIRYDSTFFGQSTYPDLCTSCRTEWPCATARAVEPGLTQPEPRTADQIDGMNYCPKCKRRSLAGGSGGGIVCLMNDCDYWYCG